MKNGTTVAAFEREFAAYVGAKYAIGLVNGTATLHTALVALGVKPGDRVAVPPLTMASTTIAVLQAGAVPVFVDVDPETWNVGILPCRADNWRMPVSLFGLSAPFAGDSRMVDDAAQTLRQHSGAAFTSYSFQASKILALGEGGALVTDDESLAARARSFSSLGYAMRPDQPRIDPAVLKSPDYARHHLPVSWNYRMADAVAERGLEFFKPTRNGTRVDADRRVGSRRRNAKLYASVVADCPWITPQYVPEGWTHDYWSYAVALESADLWHPFVNAIERHGGERPYAAWRLTYQEPAFRHLAEDGCCPAAESLQPRIVAFQTNNLASAERNADAVAKAIQEIGG